MPNAVIPAVLSVPNVELIMIGSPLYHKRNILHVFSSLRTTVPYSHLSLRQDYDGNYECNDQNQLVYELRSLLRQVR